MKLLSKNDLLKAGYEKAQLTHDMFEKIAKYEERGIKDKKYALKLFKRDFGAPQPRTVMREKAAPFSEAIRPETKAENENVAAAPKNAKLVSDLAEQLKRGWRAARPQPAGQ